MKISRCRTENKCYDCSLFNFYQRKKMSDLSRFGVSAEEELLRNFDRLIAAQGYANRSEALRDLMRDAIVKSRLEDAPEAGEVLGSLTLVYDHHASDLADKMKRLQHDYSILSYRFCTFTISHDDCMEVIVLRGEIKQVRALADAILSLKGVKHGKLFVTLPAGAIVEHRHHHSHEN
jgi:CopG family nickel-responsive transcriptional regulator